MPENGAPGAPVGPGAEEVELDEVVVVVVGEGVGWEVVVDVVVVGGAEVEVVGAGEPDLGLYLMPLAGQLDLEPSGFVATNVPVTTLPMTS